MKIPQYLIDEGYVNRIKHPTEELYLHNYTPKAQFEGLNSPVWKDYPEINWCRGLILNDKDEVIARPFSKFWNIESYENNGLPDYSSFEIFDKMDGSLGIVYPTSKGLAVATRGSFQSEQAIWATQFLNEKYPDFIVMESLQINTGMYTYLFEIIYPENRIVVDYKGQRKLVLLSAINNDLGKDLPREFVESKARAYGFEVVPKFDGITDFKDIRNLIKRDNAEGFVVLFDNGLRVKMKYEEYCRLHKLITGVSSKKIWEILSAGQDFKEILELVPDEFYQWVEKVRGELCNKWSAIMTEANNAHGFCKILGSRKQQAEYILEKHKSISGVIFSMLDNKLQKAEESAWKLCEPKYEQPFKTGVETE